jgi:hypothetical protein
MKDTPLPPGGELKEIRTNYAIQVLPACAFLLSFLQYQTAIPHHSSSFIRGSWIHTQAKLHILSLSLSLPKLVDRSSCIASCNEIFLHQHSFSILVEEEDDEDFSFTSIVSWFHHARVRIMISYETHIHYFYSIHLSIPSFSFSQNSM